MRWFWLNECVTDPETYQSDLADSVRRWGLDNEALAVAKLDRGLRDNRARTLKQYRAAKISGNSGGYLLGDWKR